MERNEDTLSTRDLASADDPATGATTPGRAMQDGDNSQASPSEQAADVASAPSSGDGASQAENVPAPASPAGSADAGSDRAEPLLPAELGTTFQRRWEEVQTRFVDEPRGAVEDADGLVANLMQQLAQGFAQERERLEAQWGRGEDISTEDLRVALQRYRSFFQRLLST
jgi:hypothetical protein